MEVKLIFAKIKKLFNANFIFMMIVSLIFTFLMQMGNREEANLLNMSYSSFLLKGFVFLFIVFSYELSKSLMQEDKRTNKVEWFLANGLSIKRITFIHTITLYLATNLLLLPAILGTGLKLEGFRWINLLDYYLFSFVSSLIINIWLLYIKNMNKFKSIILGLAFLYMASLFIERFLISSGYSSFIGLSIKYLLGFILIAILRLKTDKERITSAYY